MENIIKEKLIKNFQPSFLEVKNNSNLHKGHAGDNGSGNTHFSITISSDKLNSLNKVQSHREINKVLKDEFLNGMHALEIKVIKENS